MLAQQILNGILSGAVYALFALGFNLIFGVLGVINLTYGFYFSAGAFIALVIDDPSFAQTIRPNLFCDDDTGHAWSLRWSRLARREGRD